MDDYKEIIRKIMLKQLIMTGIPPAERWPIPTVFKINEDFLKGLMTDMGFEIYMQLNAEDKKVAIEYLENCGPEICELVNCETFEEWNKNEEKDPIYVSDEILEELNKKYDLALEF
jgi:hypothetical protein